MTPETQAHEVLLVKKFESGIVRDPITVSPDMSIRDVIDLTKAMNISGVPVVDGLNRVIGVISKTDLLRRVVEGPVGSRRESFFEALAEERVAIREARRIGTSWEELKEQHEALRARVHGELADVLTADQLAKLDELHKNRPRHRRGSMSQEDHVARMDQRLEKLTETLGLTPEQTEQLRALFEEHHANRPARGEGPPDPEVRSQRHDEFLSNLEGILTPEQLEQF